jgi:cytidylate kinase
MPVITISRGPFSGGKRLAECLSAKLGYSCVDRDVIVERAAAQGVSQEELRDALEKPPTFLERLNHKKYLYLALMQEALCEEVRTGQAVYHGNAGHLLLRGGPPLLRVRIIAPMGARVKLAEARLKLSASEAYDQIMRMDQDRRKWTQYLYGVDWDDPANYDIVLNCEHISLADACETVVTLAQQPSFDFTPASQAAMNDLALASRIRAQLALDRETAHLEISVECKDGAAAVHGPIAIIPDASHVRRVVASVPGVVSLQLDELDAPVRA